MNYYTLGRTGLRVSRLAFGTMTFGTDWGWGSDEQAARQLFDMYLDHGGNFLDTADMYTNGTSEEWLGHFIKDSGTRDKVVVATKFTFNAEPGNPNAGGNGRKNIMRAVEGSLKRLGTDYIDLYILHMWDTVTPAHEVLRTMDDLVRAGKVRHIGLSDVPAWYAAQFQTLAYERNLEPVSSIQLEYSLVERNIEHEFVPLSLAMDMGITVWSPLASGLLSGKYKPSENGANAEGRLTTAANSGNPAFEKFTERNWKIVATLEKVANELGRSMAQTAVNWVANRPGIASVLIGATKAHQLEDNLQALDFEIPEELMGQLNESSQPNTPFPYSFFASGMQAMQTGGVAVGDKPSHYHQSVLIDGQGFGIGEEA